MELHYGSSQGVVDVFWRQHLKGQQFSSDLAASKVWWCPVRAKIGHLGWDRSSPCLAAGGLTFIILGWHSSSWVDIDHLGWEDARAFLPPLPLDMPLTSKTIICTMCPSLHACDQPMYFKCHMCYDSLGYLKSHFTKLDISPDIRCIFKTKYIWASFFPD